MQRSIFVYMLTRGVYIITSKKKKKKKIQQIYTQEIPHKTLQVILFKNCRVQIYFVIFLNKFILQTI